MEQLDLFQLKQIADAEYDEAIKQWEIKKEKTQEEYANNLRNPSYCSSLGLPENLPEHAINILKQSMTLNVLGSKYPNKGRIYRKYNIPLNNEQL